MRSLCSKCLNSFEKAGLIEVDGKLVCSACNHCEEKNSPTSYDTQPHDFTKKVLKKRKKRKRSRLIKNSVLLFIPVVTIFIFFLGEGNSFQDAQRKDNITAYQEYLKKFPNGKFKEEANKRIEVLSAKLFEKKQLAEGLIKYQGQWITEGEKFEQEQLAKGLVEYYGEWITKEQLAEEKENSKLSLAERFRKQQLAKGLVKYQGEWITKEEMVRKKVKNEKKLISNNIQDQNLSNRMLVGKGKNATVLVEVRDSRRRQGFATAFCIDKSGLFVTNNHVIEHSAHNIQLILYPGKNKQKVIKAKVIRQDKEMDLALLQVLNEGNFSSLELGLAENLYETMQVMAFGFPFGQALAIRRGEYPAMSVNLGRISALREEDEGISQIQLDVMLNPGNSGGPVIDKQGKIVGVVVFGVYGSGVNFAIPVNRLKTFLGRQ